MPMTKAVIITGKKNSGKTTLVTRLIAYYTAKGLKVGTIKHDSHGSFDWDRPGKDTALHTEAGSAVTAIMGPGKLAIRNALVDEYDLRSIVGTFYGGCDIVLVEGFKDYGFPKVEILRSEISTRPIMAAEKLSALYTDCPPLPGFSPVFSFVEFEALADLILTL